MDKDDPQKSEASLHTCCPVKEGLNKSLQIILSKINPIKSLGCIFDFGLFRGSQINQGGRFSNQSGFYGGIHVPH
jgi:hypothetical protein